MLYRAREKPQPGRSDFLRREVEETRLGAWLPPAFFPRY
jgi:hypothetical protein